MENEPQPDPPAETDIAQTLPKDKSVERSRAIGLNDLQSHAGVAFRNGDYALARRLHREADGVSAEEAAFLETGLAWDRVLVTTPFVLFLIWLYAALSV